MTSPLFEYAVGNASCLPVSIDRKPLPFHVIGVGVVINSLGKVLIDQRLEGDLLGGLWEFPGGKQELGESIKACIYRELKEELGITVSVGDKIISLEHSYSHKKLRFVVHTCTLLKGEPKALASQQVRWVNPLELKNYSFPSANSRIVDQLLIELFG